VVGQDDLMECGGVCVGGGALLECSVLGMG
jgi:hypothetical protein